MVDDGPGRMRIKKHGRMLADAMMVSEPNMLGEGAVSYTHLTLPTKA